MSISSKSKRHWTSVSQASGMVAFLIIPKCSLCLFTISNTIAVCGIAPMVTPLWEYLLIGFFALFQLSITLYEMRKHVKFLPLLISALGIIALSVFLFYEQSSTFYYTGVALISLGWIVARAQKMLQRKAHCSGSSDGITLIPQS